MEKNRDFEHKRKKLSTLSDAELTNRFWELTQTIVDPMIELAKTHTSPSIERSVLLRCGFSSLEAQQLIEHALKYKVLGHGVASVILRYSKKNMVDFLTAGRKLAQGIGWEEAIVL